MFPIGEHKQTIAKMLSSLFLARTCPVPYTRVPLWSREPSRQPPRPPEPAQWRTRRLYHLRGYRSQTAALPAQTGHLTIGRHINSKYHVPALLKCKKWARTSVLQIVIVHTNGREGEYGLYLIVISSRRGHTGLIKRGMQEMFQRCWFRARDIKFTLVQMASL